MILRNILPKFNLEFIEKKHIYNEQFNIFKKYNMNLLESSNLSTSIYM